MTDIEKVIIKMSCLDGNFINSVKELVTEAKLREYLLNTSLINGIETLRDILSLEIGPKYLYKELLILAEKERFMLKLNH